MENRSRPLPSAFDDSLIARLYRQHALTLLRYVRQHVSLREDAEDIVLEVFLAALKEPGLSGLSEDRQGAWLQSVTHHKVVDYYRRTKNRPSVPLEETGQMLLTDEDQGPEQLVVRREEDALLRTRLGQLPQHYQRILYLRFASGLRCTEIASQMQKSEGAIRMLLSRALNTLREIYTEQ